MDKDLVVNIQKQLSESERVALQEHVQLAESRYFKRNNSSEKLTLFKDRNDDDIRPAVEWAIAALPIPVILAALFLELYAVYAASIWAVLSAVLILVWANTRQHGHPQPLS